MWFRKIVVFTQKPQKLLCTLFILKKSFHTLNIPNYSLHKHDIDIHSVSLPRGPPTLKYFLYCLSLLPLSVYSCFIHTSFTALHPISVYPPYSLLLSHLQLLQTPSTTTSRLVMRSRRTCTSMPQNMEVDMTKMTLYSYFCSYWYWQFPDLQSKPDEDILKRCQKILLFF